MTEITAYVTVEAASAPPADTDLNPRYRLTLVEGSRATWRIDTVTAPEQETNERVTTIGHPDRPENLLGHGLLAYIAHAHPELVVTQPELVRLVSAHTRPGHLVTSVPDDQAALRIARLMPQVKRVTIRLLPRCGFGMAQVDHLVAAGLRVVCSAGASSPRPDRLRDRKWAV